MKKIDTFYTLHSLSVFNNSLSDKIQDSKEILNKLCKKFTVETKGKFLEDNNEPNTVKVFKNNFSKVTLVVTVKFIDDKNVKLVNLTDVYVCLYNHFFPFISNLEYDMNKNILKITF